MIGKRRSSHGYSDGADAAAQSSAGAADGPADDAAGSAGISEVEGAPVLSVVSGHPTDEELAALTAVVVALQAQGGEEEAPGQARSWVRRALLRLGPTPGPGSWRRSVR